MCFHASLSICPTRSFPHCVHKSVLYVCSFGTAGTVALQALLSMGFSRQEYWNGLPFPSAGDRPDPGIKLESPTLQAGSLQSESPGKPRTLPVIVAQLLSCVQLFVTPWTVAHQASPSMGLSRQE